MGNVFDSQSSSSGAGTGRIMDEKLLTNWRTQFVEFAFQLATFLLNVRSTGMQQQHMKELTAILDQCLKISRPSCSSSRLSSGPFTGLLM